MAEPTRGLLDTSVVIDHDIVDPAALPDESAIAAVALVDLAAGPHATVDDADSLRPLREGCGMEATRTSRTPALASAAAAAPFRA